MKMYNVYKTKNTSAIVKKNGLKIGYLTYEQEEKGYDIKLDMLGYEIIAL